ncbi:stress-responsive transcription factor hsf1, partial [Chytriomyces hyalinus]
MGNGEAEGPSTYEDMDQRVTACPLRTSPSAAALLPLSGVVNPTDPGLDSGRDQAASNGMPASRKRSHCAAVVSDFVSKLFSAISGAQFKNQIKWSEAGDSFIVVDQFEFAREVMPVLFSHTNYQSFVRQLNKYGFHKLKAGDVKMGSTGAMSAEFQHASFLRDHPELLGEITRKKNVSRKLEPEVASGVGRALFSATTSASPHIS